MLASAGGQAGRLGVSPPLVFHHFLQGLAAARGCGGGDALVADGSGCRRLRKLLRRLRLLRGILHRLLRGRSGLLQCRGRVRRQGRGPLRELRGLLRDGRLLRGVRPGRLLLVRQWRYPLGRETLEIPAGTRAPGEAPEVTAARELEEEAGMRAGRLVEVLRTHLAPGVSDELMVFYRAEDLTPVPPHPDRGELLRAEEVGEADLPRLLAEGLVCDAKTLVALALEGLWP